MINSLYNIPLHTKCTNCGECCGIIPATKEEISDIQKFILKNGIKPMKKPTIICPFRDTKEKKCLIYPVRPLICRLFGVTEGTMKCKNGNSANIDGTKFVDTARKASIQLLNNVGWEYKVGEDNG